MNPCPCGRGGEECTCVDRDIARYRSRLSGPLLDRIDLQVRVGPVSWSELAAPTGTPGLNSAAARERVLEARSRQAARFGADGGVNGLVPAREVMKVCPLTESGHRLLEHGIGRYGLSARSVHRTLRVARTIADLGGGKGLGEREIAEALRLRAGLQPTRSSPAAPDSAAATARVREGIPLFTRSSSD